MFFRQKLHKVKIFWQHLSARKKMSVLTIVVFLLAIGLTTIKYGDKLGLWASGETNIINQASVSYTNAAGQTVLVSSNVVNVAKTTDNGTISGLIFNDVNRSGAKDTGEQGLVGWTIKLTGARTATVTSDSTGNYTFVSLAAGQYTVSETVQSGWTQTVPVLPCQIWTKLTKGCNVLSAPTPTNYAVSLPAHGAITGKDFGNYQSTPAQTQAD